jgi:hypothetical protein
VVEDGEAATTAEAAVMWPNAPFRGVKQKPHTEQTMNEDAINEMIAEIRDLLQARAPEITWHMVSCDVDRDGKRWVRVRAAHSRRLIQFVVIAPAEDAPPPTIAARIITEALRLLRRPS